MQYFIKFAAQMKSLRRKIVVWMLVKIPAILIGLSLLWVVALKWLPVAVTPLMIERSIEYRSDDSFHTRYRWRSYRKISPEMARAVVTSEDNLFFEHKGFDKEAIKKAIDDHKRGKRLRGASTISQQTAKNVFCLPGRSWVRKGVEAYFTVLIENIWGKKRIMEVYLNVAEMGKGIYGAEAAARAHFGCHASELTRGQACLLAACLPNPIKRNASSPGPYVRSRASRIASMEGNLAFPDWIYHK
jgi:monofunctional biosynthetic peptidoglycan transglycosylase